MKIQEAITVSGVRSGSKAWNHLPRPSISSGEATLPPPVSIEIQPTSSCNLRCKWCSYWNRNGFNGGTQERIEYSSLQRLADYCFRAGVKSIYLSGGGEPCLYPQLGKLIDELSSTGCRIALVTNGTLVEQRVLEHLDKLTYIQVSLVAVDRDAYIASTGRDHHKEVGDLPRVVRLRHAGAAPLIGGMYVISNWNLKPVQDVINLAKSSGYDYCSFRLAIDPEESGSKLDGETESKLRQELASYGVIDRSYTDLESLASYHQPARRCGETCFSIDYGLHANIAPDGAVFLCIRDIGNRSFEIGNINGTDFSSIWNGLQRRLVVSELQERYGRRGCSDTCRSHRYNASIAIGRPDRISADHPEFL